MSRVESQSGHSISAHSRQASRLSAVKNDSEGAALIIVLLIVTIVTAIVVQFASDVYTATNALYNWTYAQRTSLIARSGNELAIKTIIDNLNDFPYTSEPVEIPVDKLFAQSDARMIVSVVDENSKINLNDLVYTNPATPIALEPFKRLLKGLSLDGTIADRVADWIDTNKIPRVNDSEIGAKNGPLDSIDELLLIKGIDRAIYDKISPYVTIYGNGYININSAEFPVLMALSDTITEELAGRIIAYRKSSPFKDIADLPKNVSGIDNPLYISFSTLIKTAGDAFTITSTAIDSKVQRTIKAVIDPSGKIIFWQEL